MSMASLPVRLIARVVLSSGIGYLVSAAAVIDLNFVDLPEIVKVTTVVCTTTASKISERDC